MKLLLPALLFILPASAGEVFCSGRLYRSLECTAWRIAAPQNFARYENARACCLSASAAPNPTSPPISTTTKPPPIITTACPPSTFVGPIGPCTTPKPQPTGRWYPSEVGDVRGWADACVYGCNDGKDAMREFCARAPFGRKVPEAQAECGKVVGTIFGVEGNIPCWDYCRRYWDA